MARRKFKNIGKMVEHILADERMQNEAIIIAGVPFSTAFLKQCVRDIDRIEMRLMADRHSITSIERFGLEVIMQAFDVELRTK